MSVTHWDAVKALFSAALDLPREDRAAFLTLESGGDAALIAEVQSLLDSHEKPGAFLDTVTQEFRSQAFASSGAARSRIGERIGAYRIVGMLGSGGMGDVFKAIRDDEQYQSEVAIKLMRADMRSQLTERRFRIERQILAGLDHRNIARLLDGGTTDGGVPYVVMELVAGQPIDAWCDARHLGVRDRVQLFLQVCAAVSYAHQHLIVHRDLKPTNILVTADGSVKLLDFGIAKLLETEASTDVAKADATATTLRAMTLDYASPEQVSGAHVTTVSDVYSLGVVLYRLLTGKSPYAARSNDAARMAEILSESTPTRPSQVERKVDADLDNILLMALRKEPQRRYASVEQLASDLRNYLTGMPVSARGNSLRYRAGKFVRRRRIELAAGVFVGCALLGALVFSMREADIAERERHVAQQHFDSVRKLANTMLFQLHDEMALDAGSLKSREMLVKTSLEYLDALYQQGGSDPRLQEELANAYIKVASIQGSDTEANRGNFAGALDSYARAIALLNPLMATDPANHRAGWALANAYTEQAALLMVVRGPKFARDSANEGVALTEVFAPKITDEAERLARLVNAYVTQARILGFMGVSLEAVESLDKLIGVSEAYWNAHPETNGLSRRWAPPTTIQRLSTIRGLPGPRHLTSGLSHFCESGCGPMKCCWHSSRTTLSTKVAWQRRDTTWTSPRLRRKVPGSARVLRAGVASGGESRCAGSRQCSRAILARALSNAVCTRLVHDGEHRESADSLPRLRPDPCGMYSSGTTLCAPNMRSG